MAKKDRCTIRLETAQKIVAKGAEIGIDTRLYAAYSGRGMFGDVTDGVVVEETGDIITLCSAVTNDLQNGGAIAFIKETRRFRCDNLGKGFIYY